MEFSRFVSRLDDDDNDGDDDSLLRMAKKAMTKSYCVASKNVVTTHLSLSRKLFPHFLRTQSHSSVENLLGMNFSVTSSFGKKEEGQTDVSATNQNVNKNILERLQPTRSMTIGQSRQ
jgi:hypothetical protein